MIRYPLFPLDPKHLVSIVVSGSIPRASIDIITGAFKRRIKSASHHRCREPIVIHVSKTKSSLRSKNIPERQTFHHLRRPCPIIITNRNSNITISHYHLKLHHHSDEEDVARAGRQLSELRERILPCELWLFKNVARVMGARRDPAQTKQLGRLHASGRSCTRAVKNWFLARKE